MLKCTKTGPPLKTVHLPFNVVWELLQGSGLEFRLLLVLSNDIEEKVRKLRSFFY